MSGVEKIAVTVTDVVPLNELVTRYEFKRTDGGLLPTFFRWRAYCCGNGRRGDHAPEPVFPDV